MDKISMDFLVVDNKEEERSTILEILTKAGYQKIISASSGKNASEILKKNKTNFIITELHMPHMSGIELLKLIRRHSKLFDKAVMIVTNDSSKYSFLNALEENVDGYLLKPFTEKELLATIRKINKKKSNLSSLQQKIKKLQYLRLQEKFDDAITLGQEILQEGENLDASFIMSECYAYKKEFGKALYYLNPLVKKSPTGKNLHLYSKICKAESKSGEAITSLIQASKHNPQNLDLKIDIGKLFLSMGLEDEADKHFNFVMQSNPSDFNLIKIGKSYLKQGNLKKTGDYLNQVVDPIEETAYVFKMYDDALAKQT